MVHISTKNAELLSQHIIETLGIKGTIVTGQELDLKENKKIIMLVIESAKIIDLKYIANKYDEESFLVISDASEIMGRGH
jgi:uncharacterized membrane-anchored protein YitT (DUF2179 family)